MTKKKNKKYIKKMNFYTITNPSFECIFEDVPTPEATHTIEKRSFILEYQVTNVNETRNHTNRKRNDG